MVGSGYHLRGGPLGVELLPQPPRSVLYGLLLPTQSRRRQLLGGGSKLQGGERGPLTCASSGGQGRTRGSGWCEDPRGGGPRALIDEEGGGSAAVGRRVEDPRELIDEDPRALIGGRGWDAPLKEGGIERGGQAGCEERHRRKGCAIEGMRNRGGGSASVGGGEWAIRGRVWKRQNMQLWKPTLHT
jgi:hypothetical protein